ESMAKQAPQRATSRTAGGPSRLGGLRPAVVNGLRPAVLNGVRLKVGGRLQLEFKLAAARTGEGRVDQLRRLLEDVHGVAAPAARREDYARSLPWRPCRSRPELFAFGSRVTAQGWLALRRG